MSSTQGTSVASASTLDRLSLYLGTCCRLWLGLYLAFCCIVSVKCMMLHVAMVGFLLCLLSYFRLPACEPSEVFRILGRDPLNFDGSPSRQQARGVLGLIAHRAAPLDAPENSIEAVKKAKKAGAKTVHLNVSFTSDAVAIALRPNHIKDLTSKSCKISGDQCKDLAYKDLEQSLDLAAMHALKDSFSPCRVSKIEDLVDFCLAEDLKIFLDVSLNEHLSLDMMSDFFANHLFAKKTGLYSKAVVVSSWPQIIFAIRQKDPRIVCGLNWSPDLLRATFPKSRSIGLFYLATFGDFILSWAVHDFLWYFLGLSLVVVDKKQINAPYVQKWRSKGIRVIASPVNKSLERLYFEKQLKLTCMADTMDEIGVEKLLEEANNATSCAASH